MKPNNDTLVTAFALFSLFFGAGNLILPPFLGFSAGVNWKLVTLGFGISAVIIPLLGIIAHARLQGTMLDFANKVHPIFSILFCTMVYLISVALPAPRTASVTYEMTINPYFSWDSLSFSTVYFGLVFLFTLNRTSLLYLIGRYMTPFLIMILAMIIGIAVFGEGSPNTVNQIRNPFSEGFLEGYQTFDAIASIVVGAVVVISLNLRQNGDYNHKRKTITYGGIIAGLALFLIYAGLIYAGSHYNADQPTDSRTELLAFISYDTLGSGGRFLLSGAVGLACLTTATGIVTGTADFIQGLFKGSKLAYYLTTFIAALLGLVIGQFNTDFIIEIAVPALYFIYPLSIVLIILNVLPRKYLSHWVFKGVAVVTILSSLPDFFNSLNRSELEYIRQAIPLGKWGLGWTLPAVTAFLLINSILFGIKKFKTDKKNTD